MAQRPAVGRAVLLVLAAARRLETPISRLPVPGDLAAGGKMTVHHQDGAFAYETSPGRGRQ